MLNPLLCKCNKADGLSRSWGGLGLSFGDTGGSFGALDARLKASGDDERRVWLPRAAEARVVSRRFWRTRSSPDDEAKMASDDFIGLDGDCQVSGTQEARFRHPSDEWCRLPAGCETDL